ncbi:SGNH/GDSL hydrolase family protein [Kutzneria buriramensis]|uniref:GDSL-like lipase/acylhydrolase family protein n=1 Tax=Kutzneria buriramensis TaxID=1045776 RepID=A0A3E0IB69_9PSEU|nr:SGNH/GDSL hydrolase family protein [Kutzneria buriramensis]REH55927.1 GDSL-like lipase/acylhydrolase family protein [Kutzneria buriramensis]
MRLSRALPCLAVAVAAALSTTAVAHAAPAAVNYAAVGDSYASGVGTQSSYDNSCDRSAKGYPSLWAAAHSVSAFTNVACSGAKTSDVINSQVGSLSSANTVVTVTVGGNDAGFSSVMESCIIGGDSGCNTAVNNAKNYVNTTLPGLLDNTYNAVRGHAPNATVYVVGYPRFYQLGGSCSVGLSDTSRSYIDSGADTLDTAISAAASRHGFRFVDVRDAFANHGICSSNWWLNSVTWPVVNSYHPNASGYASGYLPALTAVTG